MNIFSGLFRSRGKPKNLGGSTSFLWGGSSSGKVVNERTAMQMTAVYSCVRILAEAIACLPLFVYRYGDDGSKEKCLEHPLWRVLHDEPNPEMTSFVFRETMMNHLLLTGNAYAQIIRNARGDVVALYPLMPDRVTVDRDTQGRLYYRYRKSCSDAPEVNQKKPNDVILAPSEVLHVLGLGFDGLVGYSPIAMAKNAVGLAIAAEEYGAKFFANGAAPSGVLEHPGTLKDPERIRESWQSTFGGSANSNKIAVLEEGLKYTPIAISPEQAQFLETRKFQINEIARIFRVPPHMLADLEKSSFSNIEQQSLEFVKYTLDPWVIRWEQAMNKSLLLESEKKNMFTKFNVDGLLRGDYVGRMNGYAIARRNGWMSSNDIRELENLDRIPEELGGDLYLINGAMTKLQDAGVFAKQTRSAPTVTVKEDDNNGTNSAGRNAPTQSNMRDLPAGATRKFWSWACDEGSGTRTLYLDGVIAEESWFDDDVTPKAFKAELYGGEGDIVIWLNSPGGDCIAASQIYAMLMDYRGDVTVKIDGIAASAASVIAMAGTKVLMAPTALMMVHNPLTVAIGDSGEMQKAIAMLGEVKESIINAYEIKTGLSRVRLSHLMDAETWLNANKAIEMGFADGILEDTKRGHPEAITFAFSRRAVTNSLMSKLIPKPESKVNTGISIEAAMQNLQARKYI